MSQSSQEEEFFRLDAAGGSFVVGARSGEIPRCVFFGAAEEVPELVPLVLETMPASPDETVRPSLFPQAGCGYTGQPGYLGHKAGRPWETNFRRADLTIRDNRLTVICVDDIQSLYLELIYELDPQSGVLTSQATITNSGDSDCHLGQLAALNFPIPEWAKNAQFYSGEWADEGHLQTVPLFDGELRRQVRDGRPGFSWSNFLLLVGDGVAESTGHVLGIHLGWSGNHEIIVDGSIRGGSYVQAAEWLAPGEIILGKGESYATPMVCLASSMNGYAGLSNRFHAFLRSHRGTSSVRPAQLNTWEGVYFDVDEKSVLDMAEAAASLGFERFVLDDGWFKGRNDDTSSLGDWDIDKDKFPNGLKPVVERINAMGVSFGIWVEPEMINPESELYKAHPEWVLQITGTDQPTGRNQLVLDLSRADVEEWIFNFLNKLLSSAKIDYLKWDFNRTLYPGSNDSGPQYHNHVVALYRILGRLQAAYPGVEVESCSSGGGRVDFEILRFTNRFWPSDNTDARERVRIQRNLSLFIPPEFLGSHAGPSPSPISKNEWPMRIRCLVALFGHFGAELDPRELGDGDRLTLTKATQVYKEYRELICTGELLRWDNELSDVDVQAIRAAGEFVWLVRIVSFADKSTWVEVDMSEDLQLDDCIIHEIFVGDTKVPYTVDTSGKLLIVEMPSGPAGAVFEIKRV